MYEQRTDSLMKYSVSMTKALTTSTDIFWCSCTISTLSLRARTMNSIEPWVPELTLCFSVVWHLLKLNHSCICCTVRNGARTSCAFCFWRNAASASCCFFSCCITKWLFSFLTGFTAYLFSCGSSSKVSLCWYKHKAQSSKNSHICESKIRLQLWEETSCEQALHCCLYQPGDEVTHNTNEQHLPWPLCPAEDTPGSSGRADTSPWQRSRWHSRRHSERRAAGCTAGWQTQNMWLSESAAPR